ncbi:unnamed protein product, partial [Brachionus calyciflorus]
PQPTSYGDYFKDILDKRRLSKSSSTTSTRLTSPLSLTTAQTLAKVNLFSEVNEKKNIGKKKLNDPIVYVLISNIQPSIANSTSQNKSFTTAKAKITSTSSNKKLSTSSIENSNLKNITTRKNQELGLKLAYLSAPVLTPVLNSTPILLNNQSSLTKMYESNKTILEFNPNVESLIIMALFLLVITLALFSIFFSFCIYNFIKISLPNRKMYHIEWNQGQTTSPKNNKTEISFLYPKLNEEENFIFETNQTTDSFKQLKKSDSSKTEIEG